jgi:hypothetical protein
VSVAFGVPVLLVGSEDAAARSSIVSICKNY